MIAVLDTWSNGEESLTGSKHCGVALTFAVGTRHRNRLTGRLGQFW
jgi:hypothetical protein